MPDFNAAFAKTMERIDRLMPDENEDRERLTAIWNDLVAIQDAAERFARGE